MLRIFYINYLRMLGIDVRVDLCRWSQIDGKYSVTRDSSDESQPKLVLHCEAKKENILSLRSGTKRKEQRNSTKIHEIQRRLNPFDSKLQN